MRLSICIPTYNRGALIGELLDSIIAQRDYGWDIEVVVSDNASTDETAAVIDSYRDRLPRLVYQCAAQNMGADRNFLKAVELATGDFCWLMGSDDKLEPGAFAHVEHAVRQHPELAGISVAAQGYHADLIRPMFIPDPIALGFKDDTLLVGRDHIATAIGPSLGYLSSIIIRRALWAAVVESYPVQDYLNSYVHIYVILNALNAKSSWLCVPHRFVGWRSGNDSFLRLGQFNRLRIDVVGYDQVFGDVLGRKSKSYHSVMAQVAALHIRMHLRGGKLRGESHDYFVKSARLTMGYYWRYPMFWLRTAPIFLVPGFAIRGARWLYRRTLKQA